MTDERAIKATTYSSLDSAVSNTLDTVNNYQNNEHVNIENKNKIKLQAKICQPVSVILERLSQEVSNKDLCSSTKKNNQSQFRKDVEEKHQQAEKENERVMNTETVLTLDRYKLRSRNRKHITKQNSYECNDTTIKQVFQNKKHIDTWKYKRKYNDLSSEEVNTSDISAKRRKRRERTKLQFKENNDKLIAEKLLSHATDSNITDTKVILTKLEDMHDNKYVINWKKKLIQQTLLTYNLECSEQYKNLSTSTSSINTVGSSHENIVENNENNSSEKKSLSSYNLKSKYKQSKDLKVLLVKLESLGVSCREQNLASEIKVLTANYNEAFELKYIAYPNNIVSNSNESNIINECINEASAHMSSAGEENDIVDEHSTNEPTMDFSRSDSNLQDVCNSKDLSEKSESMEHQESTENVENEDNVENEEHVENEENVEVLEQPRVQTNENTILPKPSENLQDIGSLIETAVNNETRMVDSSNNVTIEADISDTSLIQNLTTEAQKINGLHSVRSDVTMNSESIEQSIKDSFLYTCIACNSSFKEFRTLPLHLKKCLAKSQERKNTHDNNNKRNMSCDSTKIAETLKCDNLTKASLQEPSSTTDDNNKSLSTLTKKVSKGKYKHFKHMKKQLENRTNVQCNVCSEVFDTMVGLSNHIYKHTESELQKAYEIAKIKQASVENSEKINTVTTESNKKTKSAVYTSKRNKVQVSNITTKQKKTQIDEVSNTSSSLIPESNKQTSNLPTVSYATPVTFCDCHKPVSSDERCIELVLHCSVCKIIFRTKECFDAHLKRATPSLCCSKHLVGTIQRLYCSACEIILYSFVDMRQHAENHVKTHQHIKLFCHICKVRFIGVGPIFNLHWFNHMRNLSYTASASNFPKTSLVDSNSKIWSLITSDNYRYLIVTEHICNFCNEQFFATNQLQNHVSICPKRKNIELSRAIPANNDKEQNNGWELNLRLFCTLCKVMFKEKSLFETHAVNHKQHLQPQYICLSMTDVKRMYICNVCANVYDNLKEFTTHWQDHNAIRETFMCYRCKTNFPTLETFLDHSKQCDISRIPVHMPSCQVTYYETNFNCKICNIGFESYKALYQHSGIHNIKFPRLSIICSNEAQSETVMQKIPSLPPKTIWVDTEQPTITSNESTAEVIAIDSNVAEEKDSRPEVLKNITDTCIQSKSSTERKSVEFLENEIDNRSVNDNLSFTDADTEVLSDVETNDLNKTQEDSCPGVIDKSNDSTSKDKETEVIAADNASLINKVSVTHVNSNEKADLNETSSSSKNIEINETNMEDDVILIEPAATNKETKNTKNKSPVKVPEKNNNAPKEATNDPKSNDSSISNEKSVEGPKYLRVKNISELMDQKVKYLCSTCGLIFDTEKSLKNHSTTHNQEPLTSSKDVSILLPSFLSGADVTQPKTNTPTIQNPSNLQQGRTVAAPIATVQQQSLIPHSVSQSMVPYSVSQMSQRNMLTPFAPSYTSTYTIPTQDPNVQYSDLSSRPVVHNVNTKINTNGTYVPPTSVQSQNFYQNNQVLINMLSNVTDSSSNFMDNNHLTRTSNNESTIVLSDLLSESNAIPNQGFVRLLPQDTHSRIKLQNAIHQKCSDKTPNVTTVNVLLKPTSTSNLRLQQTPRLPVSSSNQYYFNGNFSGIKSSTDVANPPNNNSMTAVNTNNGGPMSTVYQPSKGYLNVVPSSRQRHTVHHNPSTSGPVYKCYYCPDVIYFQTNQQLNDHLNVRHNYPCEICNKRMFNLKDLFFHKLQHNSVGVQNIFQR